MHAFAHLPAPSLHSEAYPSIKNQLHFEDFPNQWSPISLNSCST